MNLKPKLEKIYSIKDFILNKYKKGVTNVTPLFLYFYIFFYILTSQSAADVTRGAIVLKRTS